MSASQLGADALASAPLRRSARYVATIRDLDLPDRPRPRSAAEVAETRRLWREYEAMGQRAADVYRREQGWQR